MALIRRFDQAEPRRPTRHAEVAAAFQLIELDDGKLVQITATGKADREMPGAVSQTIQLDEEGARQLFDILRSHFGFR